MHYLKIIAIAGAIAASALLAGAQSLPVRTIGEKQYYTYTVKAGDTLYSLQDKLNISRSEILKHNPTAADGLTPGAILIFPIDAPRTSAATVTRYTVKGNETIFGIANQFHVKADDIIALNPQASEGVEKGMTLIIPGKDLATATTAKTATTATSVTSDTSATSDTPATSDIPATSDTPDTSVTSVLSDSSSVAASDSIRVLLALPLMSAEEKLGRLASIYNEFTRGFLLGASELTASGERPVSIKVFDTSLLAPDAAAFARADAVIAAESENALTQAAHYAGDDAQVFNIFNVQDDSYESQPRMFQANISQPLMYDKAIAWLIASNPGYTVVILNREGSKAEKMPFVSALRQKLTADGIDMMEINYSGKLTEEDLEPIAPDGNYLFIPTSGSMSDLNHFGPAIQHMRDTDANPDRLRTFGYPDWIALRGEPQGLLHQLEAMYYSRYAFTDLQPAAMNVLNDYTRWYGSEPSETFPNPALLGYDTARYIIIGVRDRGSIDALMQDASPIVGIQSVFAPVKAASGRGGHVNGALFGIRCLKDNTTTSTGI